MPEFRRNPLTRKWIIFTDKIKTTSEIRGKRILLKDNEALFPFAQSICPYCREFMPDNTIFIACMKAEEIIMHPEATEAADCDIQVIAAPEPVFHIENTLNLRARRLYDVMGSPGAHEQLILTPHHGLSFRDLSVEQILQAFRMLKFRMQDLLRDPNLGHQYAYMVYGQASGGVYNHLVLNLIAAPFISEKIQRELSGAHEWYQKKERCLFCDIYEEERYKQQRNQPNGLLDETDKFVSFVPFFADSPFEIWIQPIDHYSDFLEFDTECLLDLSRIFLRTNVRLYNALGPVSFSLFVMNRPNIRWGHQRGYWETIEEDWHFSIRLIPEVCIVNEDMKTFYNATGTRINPIFPEVASEFLRESF